MEEVEEVSESYPPTPLTANELVAELGVTNEEVWVILTDAHLSTKVRMPAVRWRAPSVTPLVS